MQDQEGGNPFKRTLSILFNVAKAINSREETADILRYLAAETAALLGADSCSMMLLDDRGQMLLSKASCGLTPEEEEGITFRLGEGIAGWVAQNRAPAHVRDVSSDPRFKEIPGQQLRIGSLISVPLIVKERLIGVMTVTSAARAFFSSEAEDLLLFLAAQVVLDLENARLYQLSVSDPLTRVYNRQYLSQKLPEEISRAKRYGDALAIILFDIDRFKETNDTYGHDAGDRVLVEIARFTAEWKRGVDLLARYGGDEFIVVLPKTTALGAMKLAERLREKTAEAVIAWKDDSLRISLSLGVAELDDEMRSDTELVSAADKALYAAKRAGRNRAEVFNGKPERKKTHEE